MAASKIATLTFRIDPTVKEGLRAMAAKENRIAPTFHNAIGLFTTKAREILDRIFKNSKTKCELSEFEGFANRNLSQERRSGRDSGKTRYFAKSIVRLSPP